MATKETSPAPRADPAYYRDGETWERDIARRNRNSRSIAWVVAAAMTTTTLALGVALATVIPLKTYEPYMIVVDKSSGFVEVKRPTAVGALSQDEAITMFNVARYVRARETYDPKSIKDNFDLAQLLSTGKASNDLTELWQPSNPKRPSAKWGASTVASVFNNSITFPNNKTAMVRFSTEEKSNASVSTNNYVSIVRFQYSSTPMRNEYRFENPLGFQTVEYRRDQETVQADGSVGQ